MADTITDKGKIKIQVVNKSRFEKLNEKEQKVFEFLRNSILELFPLTGGVKSWDDDIISFAENYAFINIKGLLSLTENIITPIIKDLITEMVPALIPAPTETPSV